MRTVANLNDARRFATFEEARDVAASCGYPSARVEAFPRGYYVSCPGSGWGNDRWLATDEVLTVWPA